MTKHVWNSRDLEMFYKCFRLKENENQYYDLKSVADDAEVSIFELYNLYKNEPTSHECYNKLMSWIAENQPSNQEI